MVQPTALATRVTRYVLIAVALLGMLWAAGVSGRLQIDDWWPWDAVAALVNSVATLAAIASSERSHPWGLWLALAAFAACVAIAAVLSLLFRGSSFGARIKRISSAFGTARVLGFSVLALEAFTSQNRDAAWPLLSAVAAAAVLTSPAIADAIAFNLPQRVRSKRRFQFLSSEAPNLLTVSGPTGMERGTTLSLRISEHDYSARVIAGHPTGMGAVLVLSTYPDLALEALVGVSSIAFTRTGGPEVMGVIVEGTTVEELVVRPTQDLPPGVLLSRNVEGVGPILYQVSRSQLVRFGEDSRFTTEPRTWASQLGRAHDDGRLEPVTSLALPFELVERAGALTATLPANYLRIGNLVGTSFPVGFETADALTGHVAVLGMSGMGKSTLVRRLADGLAPSNLVGVIDVGGEYVQHLGLTEQPLANYLAAGGTGAGVVALGPGTVVQSFRNMADSVLAVAQAEYAAGSVRPRVLIAEEAHSLVPEWNFVIGRYDSQEVAASCATILQARKFGLRFVLVSQRTANVSKSAISQCANYVVFRMVDETGLDYLSSVAGPSYVDVVRTLAPYQALVVGPAFSTTSPVVIDTIDWPRSTHTSTAATDP